MEPTGHLAIVEREMTNIEDRLSYMMDQAMTALVRSDKSIAGITNPRMNHDGRFLFDQGGKTFAFEPHTKRIHEYKHD